MLHVAWVELWLALDDPRGVQRCAHSPHTATLQHCDGHANTESHCFRVSTAINVGQREYGNFSMMTTGLQGVGMVVLLPLAQRVLAQVSSSAAASAYVRDRVLLLLSIFVGIGQYGGYGSSLATTLVDRS